MSELIMQVGNGFTVLVDYDYQPSEKGSQETPPVAESVTINAVFNAAFKSNIDVINILSQNIIETIEQNVLDSFDKELQEPDYENIRRTK